MRKKRCKNKQNPELSRQNKRLADKIKARPLKKKPRLSYILFSLIQRRLELCILWCTWEWNHVTDVLHTGYEEDQTLETETETCMWA